MGINQILQHEKEITLHNIQKITSKFVTQRLYN